MSANINQFGTSTVRTVEYRQCRSAAWFWLCTSRSTWRGANRPCVVERRTSRKSSRSGVSLIELLAVVTVLGIVALVVAPRINFSSATARENICFQNKTEVNAAVERYFFDNGSLPVDLAAVNGTTYFPAGVPNCPVSGNPYSLDATTKRVTGHTVGSHP